MISTNVKHQVGSVKSICSHVFPAVILVTHFSFLVRGDYSKCPDATRPKLDTEVMSRHQQVVVFVIPERFESLPSSKQLHCALRTDEIPRNDNHAEYVSEIISHPLTPCTSNNPDRVFYMDSTKSEKMKRSNGCTHWFECNFYQKSANAITVTSLEKKDKVATDIALTFDFVEVLIPNRHTHHHFKYLLLCFEWSSPLPQKPLPWYPRLNFENFVYSLGVIVALYLVYLLWKSSENEQEELDPEHAEDEKKTNEKRTESVQDASDSLSDLSSAQSLATALAQRRSEPSVQSSSPKREPMHAQRSSPSKVSANNRYMPRIGEELPAKTPRTSCTPPLQQVNASDGSFLKMSRSVRENPPPDSLEMSPILTSYDHVENYPSNSTHGRHLTLAVPTFSNPRLKYESSSRTGSLRSGRNSIDINMPAVPHPLGRGRIIRRTSVPYAGGNAYSYLRTSHC